MAIFQKLIFVSAARSVTVSTPDFSIPEANAIELFLNISSVSGTTPTLRAALEAWDPFNTADPAPGVANYVELATSATFTTAVGVRRIIFTSVPFNTAEIPGAAAYTAIQVATPHLWRLRFVIGGTIPSFTFGAVLSAHIF